eukprot:315962-Pelagomonas_calceolata.AAC.1
MDSNRILSEIPSHFSGKGNSRLIEPTCGRARAALFNFSGCRLRGRNMGARRGLTLQLTLSGCVQESFCSSASFVSVHGPKVESLFEKEFCFRGGQLRPKIRHFLHAPSV